MSLKNYPPGHGSQKDKKEKFSIVKSNCGHIHEHSWPKLRLKAKWNTESSGSAIQRLKKKMYQMHVWYRLSFVFYGLQVGFRFCHNSIDLNSVTILVCINLFSGQKPCSFLPTLRDSSLGRAPFLLIMEVCYSSKTA